MKRATPRQRSIYIPRRCGLLLCMLLAACDGSVQLCGEYACLYYQNDYQNNNQNTQQNGFQNEPQIRQCETASSIRDRAPDILNQLRQANRACGSQASGLNLTQPSQILIWDDTLAQVSTNHARDMAANGFESFIGSDGLGTKDRIQQAGFSASIITESVETGPQTVAEVINNWLDIQTDCEQLLGPKTTRIGMACALPDPQTAGPYWSLLLAEPIE